MNNKIQQHLYEIQDSQHNQFFIVSEDENTAVNALRKSSFSKKPDEVLTMIAYSKLNKDWNISSEYQQKLKAGL
jgi:hypothetical protein